MAHGPGSNSRYTIGVVIIAGAMFSTLLDPVRRAGDLRPAGPLHQVAGMERQAARGIRTPGTRTGPSPSGRAGISQAWRRWRRSRGSGSRLRPVLWRTPHAPDGPASARTMPQATMTQAGFQRRNAAGPAGRPAWWRAARIMAVVEPEDGVGVGDVHPRLEEGHHLQEGDGASGRPARNRQRP